MTLLLEGEKAEIQPSSKMELERGLKIGDRPVKSHIEGLYACN